MREYRLSTEIKECKRCGYSEFKEMLHVHHIDEDNGNNADSNKLVLCHNCHVSLHRGLWKLRDIGIDSDIEYSHKSYVKKKKARIEAGIDEWNPRGKDKQKRKTEGYTERWVKWREAKALEKAMNGVQ